MDQQGSPLAIARLRSTWDAQVQPSTRRATLALVVALFFGVAHVARLGSPLARGIAAGLLAGALVGLTVRALWARRRRGDPRVVIRDTVARMDPDLGASALRALSLVDRTATDERAGSPSLAGLHLQRQLSRISLERLGARAAEVAVRWSSAGLVLAAAGALFVLFEPFRIVEGFDVLASQDGDAPLRLQWVDEVLMGAAPPEYLHQAGSDVRPPFRRTSQPRGTTLTVRGRPLHPGRPVVLTDGTTDVPFLDDGSGHLVARWTVMESTKLYIAAQFGNPRAGGVRIRQLNEQEVVAIPDEVPKVTVEGAPRTVKLLDEPNIPIHYEATDDHGLREVDLVLRAGSREERRVLSHPAADVLVDRGGYEITARDGFFKKVYTPVEVTVEARDNDVVAGPKWGKSPAIVVVPPQVGEPEALRYLALLKARDAMTDLTATRTTDKAPTAAGSKDHVAHEAEIQAAAVKVVKEALSGSYAGLEVRGRVVSLTRGQLRRLQRALDAEKKSPSAATHQKLLDETENVLLAIDAGIRALGADSARSVAMRLADVATDTAADLAAAASAADPKGNAAHLEAALAVLDGGGKQLLKLGELGLDLGEIVANDLRRIARAREAHDLKHAELAARDLAARLRRPNPSFSGGGGHGGGNGGRGGVESGAPSGADSGEASGADEAAEADQREMEDLAREHENEIVKVGDTLERAVSAEELEALKKEAKQHAEAIREAVKKLPASRGETGAAEAAASAGREEAEAMAGALEGGRPRDAVENGRRASQKLGEAQRAAEQAGGFFPEDKAGREAAGAKPTIDRELAWAEDALAKLRKASSERAKAELKKHSKEEQQLAEKAREMAKKGDSGDRSMPQEMLDRLSDAEQAMREAERSLQQGDGQQGLRRQQDAQRLLEMAMGEHDNRGNGDGHGADGENDGRGKTDIPDKDKHKSPAEFRKRVMDGLGGSSDPRFRGAVKRYAEGLLK